MQKIFLTSFLMFVVVISSFGQFSEDDASTPIGNMDYISPAQRSGITGIGVFGGNDPTTLFQVRKDPGLIFNQISQVESGSFGLFGIDDKWIALGLGNSGAPFEPYGLAISDEDDFAFFNLLQEGPRKNLLTTFAGNIATGEPSRYIVRSQEDIFGTAALDLITADPQGATGFNEFPKSSLWVNSRFTDGTYDFMGTQIPIQRSIAIVGRQKLDDLGGTSPGSVSTASAIGNQANNSLQILGIAAEGFRAQIPDFETVAVATPPFDEGVATNLQVVKTPFGGVNSPPDVFANPFNAFEYAELTWQDFDWDNDISPDCNVFSIADAQNVDKFFISFRNGRNVNPFSSVNKVPVMTFQGNARVGINTTQPTSGVCNDKEIFLDVNGAIVSGGSLVSSDRRFKKDIQPIENGLALVRKMQGTTYTFDHERFPERKFFKGNQFGFIAQDLEEVVPEVTMVNSDGYYAVDYTMLIPVLTEAIKEQDAVVAEQKEIIAQLEAELQDIRNQVMDLRSADIMSRSEDYQLGQNAPNPFNGATQINYSLPKGVAGASVNVYDLNGRLLQSYPLNDQSGKVEINASDLPSGIYLYDLLVGGQQMDVKRMVLNRMD
ncbi:MAG: tail fiber domain-containing protein [Bacteroidota bacterium]